MNHIKSKWYGFLIKKSCSIWLNPVLFNRTYEETINRIKFIQFTMKQLGVDVIDDMLIKNIENNLRGIGINEINK